MQIAPPDTLNDAEARVVPSEGLMRIGEALNADAGNLSALVSVLTIDELVTVIDRLRRILSFFEREVINRRQPG